MTTPKLSSLRHHKGIAGQFSISADVTYPNEEASRVEFVGSVYGGPVVMVTPGDPKGTLVDDPNRFGNTFGPWWVKRFFGAE